MATFPMQCLKTSLSNSTTWQTWTDSDDATEAAACIAFYEDESLTFPIAVINRDSFGRESIATNTAIEKGSLMLEFLDELTETNTVDDFEDNCYACLRELEGLASTTGCLAVTGSSSLGQPVQETREGEATTVNTIYAAFRVEYWGS